METKVVSNRGDRVATDDLMRYAIAVPSTIGGNAFNDRGKNGAVITAAGDRVEEDA